MEKIYNLSYELKSLIDNDERIILLNQLEDEMNNNEEVMRLAYVKDSKADAYETALRFFKEDSEEAQGTNIRFSYESSDTEHDILVDASVVFTLSYDGTNSNYQALQMWKSFTDSEVASALGATAFTKVNNEYVLTLKLSDFIDEDQTSFVTENDETILLSYFTILIK